jgi:hypothetical protein
MQRLTNNDAAVTSKGNPDQKSKWNAETPVAGRLIF